MQTTHELRGNVVMLYLVKGVKFTGLETAGLLSTAVPLVPATSIHQGYVPPLDRVCASPPSFKAKLGGFCGTRSTRLQQPLVLPDGYKGVEMRIRTDGRQ